MDYQDYSKGTFVDLDRGAATKAAAAKAAKAPQQEQIEAENKSSVIREAIATAPTGDLKDYNKGPCLSVSGSAVQTIPPTNGDYIPEAKADIELLEQNLKPPPNNVEFLSEDFPEISHISAPSGLEVSVDGGSHTLPINNAVVGRREASDSVHNSSTLLQSNSNTRGTAAFPTSYSTTQAPDATPVTTSDAPTPATTIASMNYSVASLKVDKLAQDAQAQMMSIGEESVDPEAPIFNSDKAEEATYASEKTAQNSGISKSVKYAIAMMLCLIVVAVIVVLLVVMLVVNGGDDEGSSSAANNLSASETQDEGSTLAPVTTMIPDHSSVMTPTPTQTPTAITDTTQSPTTPSPSNNNNIIVQRPNNTAITPAGNTNTDFSSFVEALRDVYAEDQQPEEEEEEEEDLADGSPLLGILPDFTREALQDDSSPQSQAFDWLINHPNLDAMPNVRKRQLFALATFSYSFGGLDSMWPSYDANECSWPQDLPQEIPEPCDSGQYWLLSFHGLRSNQFGLPPELSLLHFLMAVVISESSLRVELSELLPTHLGSLSYLHLLYLPSNGIAGTIPTTISSFLRHLKDLLLVDNEISGTIPTEIGRMRNLQMLELGANNLEGEIPTELGQLTKLEHLGLAFNWGLSGTIPTEIGLMTSLKTLYLVGTNLTGWVPDEVCSLPNLEEILIDYYNRDNVYCNFLCAPCYYVQY